MKKSRPTIPFAVVCIGAIIAAWGIGLGISKILPTGAEGQAKVAAKSKKPAEEPAKDKVAAKPDTTPETPDELQDSPSPEEEPILSDERNVSEEEKPKAVREVRPLLSKEDSVKFREELHQLMDRAGEMTEGEKRRSKAKILGKYGLPLPDGYLDGYE